MIDGLKNPLDQGITLFGRVGRNVESRLAQEQDRLSLWLPVFLGLGVGIYFALPVEPAWWAGAVLAILAAALFAMIRSSRSMPAMAGVAAAALLASALGLTAAQLRAVVVAAPVLAEKIGPVSIEGRVVFVEILPAKEGARVTLEKLRISRVEPDRTPEAVRVRLRRLPAEPLVPGDWISARAILSPPSGPVAPGGFDFQRHAYFRSLGAVGFIVGDAHVTARAALSPQTAGAGEFWLALERLRQSLTRRIQAAVPGDAGAISAALMTGDRSAISAPVNDAMRDSGLVHLLSISGLHVSLVAAILFVGLRGLLALVPPIALNFPIKKWTAALAIPGTLAYGVLSGMAAPTQRSVIMVAMVMLAVLADRRALSLRTLAWAAAAILLVQPESLFNPGFQMSFASVAALLAVFEATENSRRDAAERPWWRTGIVGVFALAVATSIIATAATAPFAVYHFNRFAAYGLVANMIAIPLNSFWVMPWAVAAFALMPFGLEAYALVPMGLGVEATIRVAQTVAAWPGAATMMPSMPLWGLIVAVAGGLWLCLWRQRWRYAGAAFVVAGMLSAALTRPPDVLVDGEGRLLAVRTIDGGLAVSSPRAARLSRDTWLRLSGVEGGAFDPWPRSGAADDAGRLRCDAAGCIVRAHGRAVALVRDRAALIEDCAMADLVLSLVPAKRICAGYGRAVVIDRNDLRALGAHAVWIGEKGIEVRAANDLRGERPWVLKPHSRYARRPPPETNPPSPSENAEGETD